MTFNNPIRSSVGSPLRPQGGVTLLPMLTIRPWGADSSALRGYFKIDRTLP
jgi:hypothetical protein